MRDSCHLRCAQIANHRPMRRRGPLAHIRRNGQSPHPAHRPWPAQPANRRRAHRWKSGCPEIVVAPGTTWRGHGAVEVITARRFQPSGVHVHAPLFSGPGPRVRVSRPLCRARAQLRPACRGDSGRCAGGAAAAERACGGTGTHETDRLPTGRRTVLGGRISPPLGPGPVGGPYVNQAEGSDAGRPARKVIVN